MDKKTFKAICKNADLNIEKYIEQKRQSEAMYIKSNCRFEAGDVVKVTHKTNQNKPLFAYVHSIYVDKEGEIQIQWTRASKTLEPTLLYFNVKKYDYDNYDFEVIKKASK